MPPHASSGAQVGSLRRAAAAVVEWYGRRERAHLGDARGWWWAALVAMTFFWMSNPGVFIPSFYLSLGQALVWTKLVVVLSLPWLRLPRVPWPWVAFLGLALLSQTWTISDFHTDVSNIVYLQVTLLAVLVAVNVEPTVIAWGLAAGGAVVVGLSVHAFQQNVPGSSYAALEGVIFTGVGQNQNILAYTVALSLAATLAIGWPTRPEARALWLVALATNFYGIYLARSATGYVGALVILVAAGAVALWPRLRTRHRRVAVTWAAGALVAVVATLFVVVGLLDKQLSTFSGRVPFWRATIEVSLHHSPVWGSGWGAVWEHPWNPAAPNDVASEIYETAGLALPHGHNFFVDVLPELGLLGLALAVIMVAYAVRAIARTGVHGRSESALAGRLLLLCLVALLVFGVTEPMLTVPVGWWSLTVLVTSARLRQRPRSRGRRARTV